MTQATPSRSAADRKVAGVCAGMAQHWGVDPLVVRLACALLAVSGGVGVVLYLAGWLMMPGANRSHPTVFDTVGDQLRSWPRELRIALVVVGGVVMLGMVRKLTPFGFGPAVVLALVWYFGYYKTRGRRRVRRWAMTQQLVPTSSQLTSSPPLAGSVPAVRPPLTSDTPFTQAVADWQQRVAHVRAATATPPAYPPYPVDLDYQAYPLQAVSPVPAAADPVRPDTGSPAFGGRRRVSRANAPSAKRLRLAATGVLVLTMVGLAGVDRGVRPVPVAGYLATALLVLGLTLVAATWLGRAPGILPVALLVMLATLVTTATGPVASAYGWDSQQLSYRSASQLVAGDQRRLGMLSVDLTQLAVTENANYRAHVDAGALRVTVPKGAHVVVNWRLRSGAFVVDGEDMQAGEHLSGVKHFPGRDPLVKTVVLELSVDRGVLEVRR
ncbi:MAG TPA: PspC domain-containing protein [Propionibacteriaceae bacterium]|nr:PspC domain-containing protein [Propionibacteriaceae bacterium]